MIRSTEAAVPAVPQMTEAHEDTFDRTRTRLPRRVKGQSNRSCNRSPRDPARACSLLVKRLERGRTDGFPEPRPNDRAPCPARVFSPKVVSPGARRGTEKRTSLARGSDAGGRRSGDAAGDRSGGDGGHLRGRGSSRLWPAVEVDVPYTTKKGTKTPTPTQHFCPSTSWSYRRSISRLPKTICH